MKYKAIAEYIESEINNGSIKIGGKIPSIREIAARFKCSNSTVVKAYDELEKIHCIYSIPQSGYYAIDITKASQSNKSHEAIDLTSAAPHSSVLPYTDFQHCIVQAIELYKENLFLYAPPNGLPSLVEELERLFWEYQIFTKCKNIFIVNGSQQAINILAQIPFPNGKNKILVEQPTYSGAIHAFNISKSTILGIRRGIDGIDLEELEGLFSTGSIKFFYAQPRFQNPTGASYSSKEKKEIARLAQKYDVFIVEDDYLGDMDKDTKSMPIISYDDSSRVIYIKSFSKVLLPGLRIAAVIIPDALINSFQYYKKWSDLNTSVVSQGALELYIKSGMFLGHRKKIISHYSQKMNKIKNILNSTGNKDIEWYVPDSGFFLSCKIKNSWSSDGIISKMKEENVILADMKSFFLEKHYDNKLLRISIARADTADIEKAICSIMNIVSNTFY